MRSHPIQFQAIGAWIVRSDVNLSRLGQIWGSSSLELMEVQHEMFY